MSRYTVALLPDAEEELREALLWYRARSPVAADAFRAAVFCAIDGLADHADRWPVDDAGFSFCNLTRCPYTIWHEVDGTSVNVLAAAHQHRRPGY